MTTKKTATKKKRKYTPPAKFEDFPPAVQKKARNRVNQFKNDTWRLQRESSQKLPAVPTKKLEKVKVEVRVDSKGKGWRNVRHPVNGFLTSVGAAVRVAQKKGAKDCGIEVSQWDGVRVIGYRQETDAEFKKRVTEAQIERAVIVLSRQEREESAKREQEESRKRNRLRRVADFKEAARNLSKADIEQFLKEVEDEKKAQKEPDKVAAKKVKKTTPFL